MTTKGEKSSVSRSIIAMSEPTRITKTGRRSRVRSDASLQNPFESVVGFNRPWELIEHDDGRHWDLGVFYELGEHFVVGSP